VRIVWVFGVVGRSDGLAPESMHGLGPGMSRCRSARAPAAPPKKQAHGRAHLSQTPPGPPPTQYEGKYDIPHHKIQAKRGQFRTEFARTPAASPAEGEHRGRGAAPPGLAPPAAAALALPELAVLTPAGRRHAAAVPTAEGGGTTTTITKATAVAAGGAAAAPIATAAAAAAAPSSAPGLPAARGE